MTPTDAPRRGDIWLARLDKARPVVVLSRDRMVERLNAVLVAPVTTRLRATPTQVRVGREEGLSRPSAVSLDNIQPVRRTELIGRIGRVQPSKMEAICEALAFAIGCRTAS